MRASIVLAASTLVRSPVWRRAAPAALLCAAMGVALPAGAAPLSFTVDHADQSGPAGATYEFFGTVRNDSGQSLLTSDLFFDFSGYDPAFLSPTQLLGDTISSLAPGAVSGTLALFEIALAPAATQGSTFRSDALLQDIGGDLSDPVSVSVSVVPEPSSFALTILALASLAWRVRRRPSRESAFAAGATA